MKPVAPFRPESLVVMELRDARAFEHCEYCTQVLELAAREKARVMVNLFSRDAIAVVPRIRDRKVKT